MTAEAQPWVLITGNGAFGDTAERVGWQYDANPSSEVALALDGEVIAGHRVRGVALEWRHFPAEAIDPILEEAAQNPPVIAIGLGVFSGRPTVSVERLAANVRDFQFSEDGYRPAGDPVFSDGPAAYFATLPIKAVAQSIRGAGVPALVSNTASTHGCNSVMYTLLHRAAERGLPMRAGFLHLPDPPGHVAAVGSDGPSMAIELQIEAVRTAIAAAIAHPDADIELPANEWEW